MKRYRILTNGNRFRVQRHVRVGPVRFWKYVHVYEIRDSYPKVVKRVFEFDSEEEADEFIRDRLQAESPRQPEKREWWTVRKYGERKAAPPPGAMMA